MKSIMKISIGLSLFLLFAVNALAFDVVGSTKINYVENGWFGEGLAVYADHGIAGCGADDTQFFIDESHPSYTVLASIVLTAFSTQSDVQIVTVTGTCLAGDRTKILSVRLLR
jgi:hypothetical protein